MFALPDDLGIGTADDNFHFEGILPHVSDRLKSSVKTGVIDIAVPLSIFPEIPSGPEALLVSKAINKLKIEGSATSNFGVRDFLISL